MNSPELLERVRSSLHATIASFREAGNRLKEVEHLLRLARLESDLGDPDKAVGALRTAEQVLGTSPDGGDGATRAQRATLEELWQPYADRRAERLAAAPARRMFNLAAELAFVWADLDAERALREIEKLKSSALLQVMRDDPRQRDSGLVAALDSLGADGEELVRPRNVAGMREAFVDFFVGESQTLVLLERADEAVQCFAVDVGRTEIGAAVEKMRRDFDGGGMFMPIIPDAPEEVSLEEIHALGRKLMPFADDLVSADLVCVFPHGALHSFPFAAIPVGDGTPLVEHTAVVYSLSRRTLAVSRAASRSDAGSPFFPRTALTVGVPALDEPDPGAFLGEAEFLASLGVLEEEPLPLETPQDTTVERVLSSLGKYDFVHFNCHGRFSARNPLDSCLLLSDGHSAPSTTSPRGQEGARGELSARRIVQTHLDAEIELVLLRACSSGVTNVREGDEQEGLLRAFVHAGVATCIVARWKIDAASSRKLIRAFYRAWLVDRLPKGFALQRAQKELIGDDLPYLHHPFHWAPFNLVGNWW